MKIVVIKKEVKPKEEKDKYIESHELSLLSLLVAKHPERAREFLARLRDSLKAVKTVKADAAISIEKINGTTLATPDARKAGSFALDTFTAEGYPKYQSLKDDAEKRNDGG